MKSAWKVIRTVLIVLFCLEILLQLYNPFTDQHTTGSSKLQDYATSELKGLDAHGFSDEFKHTKNALGFRGPEMTPDSGRLKIICMGGSSTECFFLDDGKDWPGLLSNKLQAVSPDIWLNNAGFAGQTIHDHLNLLKKQVSKIKPDFIFLMCGLDDIGKQAKHSKFIERSRMDELYHFFELPKIFKKSSAAYHPPVFKILDLNNVEMFEQSDSTILQRIGKEQPLLAEYKKNLQAFSDYCKAQNIRLVLISETILFGEEMDPVSDINLGNVKTGEVNGRTEALLLKQYNKSTYDIAEANQLPFINLSARLPKDSRFFYDGFHFTVEGAEMVSNIIFDESNTLLKKTN